MAKKQQRKSPTRISPNTSGRAKYPRHSVERALRIPRAILDQNAGKPVTPQGTAALLGGTSALGPFAVEIASAKKYGFLVFQEGKLHVTDLARRIDEPSRSSIQNRSHKRLADLQL